MKIAKKALALLLCTVMFMSCLYVGGDLSFFSDAFTAHAAPESQVSLLDKVQDENSARLELNFNKNWKFQLKGTNSWVDVDLPHDFSIEQDFETSGRTEPESGNLPGGIGYYKKTFIMPKLYEGKNIVLTFDGAYNKTTVKVNGKELGINKYGYNSFSFDISKNLTYDGKTENKIEVTVEAEPQSSRWYPGAGIYRDVTMTITDALHVGRNSIKVNMPKLASSNGADGTIDTELTVKNDSNIRRNFKVVTTLINSKGLEISKKESKPQYIEPGQVIPVKLTNANNSPALWSPDTPTLYTLRTEVLTGDGLRLVDTIDTTFGYRWTNWDKATGFSLNGKNTKIEGVCLHHDQGALGAIQEYDAIYRQIMILKDMGVNAVRSSHNSASKVLIDVCNEVGMLVMEEFFDGWDTTKNGNKNDFHKYFNAAADSRILDAAGKTCAEFNVAETIKRDRNDPSIIIWSAGNELNEGTYPIECDETIAPKIRKWVKDNDLKQGRPLTFGNNLANNTNLATITESMDVIGGNYHLTDWQPKNGVSYDKPFIGTETASAVCSRGEYKWTELGNNSVKYVNDKNKRVNSYDNSWVGWGNSAAAAWDNVITNDWNSGEFVWTGFDYIGEPTPWNNQGSNGPMNPNSSYFGIVDTAGFPKDSYYLYRSVWNDETTTLHLVPGTWNKSNLMVDSNGFVNVGVYSNADKIQLLLNGKVIAEATSVITTTKAGHQYKTWTESVKDTANCNANEWYTAGGNDLYPQFNVKHAAGTLSVKAFKNGKDVTAQSFGVKSITDTATNPATKIVAKTWNNITEYTADGDSLIYVELEAQNAKNEFVNDCGEHLEFTVTGNATIEGVDHGCQGSTSKFQQRGVLTSDKTANINLYNGKAVVILRTTENAGKITLNINGSTLPVEGNEKNLFRAVKANGNVTVNAVPETKAEITDEFEEIIPQFINVEVKPEGIAPNNSYLVAKSGGSDQATFRYPSDLYIDMSETLQELGYKIVIAGGDKETHYGGGTEYRFAYFPTIWGGNSDGTSPTVTDHSFSVDAFSGYGVDKKVKTQTTEDSEGWHKYPHDGFSDTVLHEKYWHDELTLKLKGTPKQVGNYDYSLASNKDPLIYENDLWKWGAFGSSKFHHQKAVRASQTDLMEGSRYNVATKQNEPCKDIHMVAHIYDKTILKEGAQIATIKGLNSTYTQYVSSNNWDAFVNSFTDAAAAKAQEIYAKREVTQAEIDAAAQPMKSAITEANKLTFKAPQSSLDALKAQLDRAARVVAQQDYETLFTKDSRRAFELVYSQVASSGYATLDKTHEYTIDTKNPDSYNAGYKAYNEDTDIKKLTEDLKLAIDALQAEQQMKVNARIFKYGYNNSNGNRSYNDGGHLYNKIVLAQQANYFATTEPYKTKIENAVDGYFIAGPVGDDARKNAEKQVAEDYAELYSVLFTDNPVNGVKTPKNYYRTAWNKWAKMNTTAPGESSEQGASVQGLASPTLTMTADGSYFTSHPSYPGVVSYINYTSIDSAGTNDLNFVMDSRWFSNDGGSVSGRTTKLYPFEGVAPKAPEFFKKEVLDANGHSTNATSGRFSKYYWDTKFPLKAETIGEGINRYTFDSSDPSYLLQANYNDKAHKAEMNLIDTTTEWSVNTTNGTKRGFFPFNYQEGAAQHTGENAIYHFGMTFDTDFYIPQAGQYENNQDIIFSFTGDDDVYVYIDDVLVLDNGGIHGARTSTINFTDMSVSYQFVQQVGEKQIKTSPKDPATGNITYTYREDGHYDATMSADNRAALDKLYEVKNDHAPHKLTFFFLERGAGDSNCKIDFNVKAASKDVKLNPQSYVVDFDATAKTNIKKNDTITERATFNKCTQEYLGITEINNYAPTHDIIEFEREGFTPVIDHPFVGNKVTVDGNYGSYTLNKGLDHEGEITFKPNSMKYNGQDKFYVVSKVTNDPSFAEGAVYYVYESVTFSPATSVYYEDNSKAITYVDGKAVSGNTGEWSVIGNEKSQDDLTIALKRFEPNKGHYGYHDEYANFDTVSGGAAHQVTVSQKNNPNAQFAGGAGGKWPTASFEFTGTGFDLISAASNQIGAFKITVQGKNTGTKTKLMDAYYGYSYGRLYMTAEGTVTLVANETPVYKSVNGAYTVNPTHYDANGKVVDGAGENPAYAYGWLEDSAHKTDSLYQIPVIKYTDLPYDDYTVTITPMYSSKLDHKTSGQYDFILDAVRIYDPIPADNKTTNGLHLYHGEGKPERIELQQYLIGSEVAGATTEIQGTKGAILLNGAALDSKDLDSYKIGCPKHEVYLAKNSAVAFELWSTQKPVHAKLGAKLLKGQPELEISVNGNAARKKLTSSTDLMYNFSDILGENVLIWHEATINGQKWYHTDTITLKNASNNESVISLTNVELTFYKDANAQIGQPQATVRVNANTPRIAMAAMNMHSADLKVTKVANPVLTRDKKGNAVVTLKVATSLDVDKLIIMDGEEVVKADSITSTVNGNVKTWTIKVTEMQLGRHTYTIAGATANGFTGTNAPLEMTFNVKKMPAGYLAGQAIKEFFEKLFGIR